MSRRRYKAPTCNDCMWFHYKLDNVNGCPILSENPDTPACKKDFMRSDFSRLNHNKHGMGYPKISAGYNKNT